MIQIAFLTVVLILIFVQRKLSVKTCFCEHYKTIIQDDLFLRFYPHYSVLIFAFRKYWYWQQLPWNQTDTIKNIFAFNHIDFCSFWNPRFWILIKKLNYRHSNMILFFQIKINVKLLKLCVRCAVIEENLWLECHFKGFETLWQETWCY